MYQGHLADGSSVQKHSAGGIYPYIVFAKQQGDARVWGVLTPSGEESFHSDYDTAVNVAVTLKGLH